MQTHHLEHAKPTLMQRLPHDAVDLVLWGPCMVARLQPHLQLCDFLGVDLGSCDGFIVLCFKLKGNSSRSCLHECIAPSMQPLLINQVG
jgi:hypothetical protein